MADGLSKAMMRFTAQHEYTRSVENVLAHRSRLLFLDAAATAAVAPAVANVLQEETGRDAGLESFLNLAVQYGSLGGAKKA